MNKAGRLVRAVGSGKSAADSRYRILTPTDHPPKGPWKGMEVLVRDQAQVGDRIEVRTLNRRDGRPLPGAKVRLLTPFGDEVVASTADASGRVVFTAPSVEFPTAFTVDVSLKGYSTYIGANDIRAQRMLMPRGVQPWTSTVVSPLIFPAIVPTPTTTDFEIDQAFGWANGVRGFKALIDKATQKQWQADDDWWANKSDLLEHFSQKGPEDMWTFFGHSGLNPLTGKVEALMAWQAFFLFRGGKPVTVKELCDAAKLGNGPPGMVVLGACQSADLLAALVKCCVKVAVGFTKPLSLGLIAETLVIFWEALLDGKTLARALREANDHLANRPYLNPDDCTLVFRAKPHIRNPRGKTLEQILEAKRIL